MVTVRGCRDSVRKPCVEVEVAVFVAGVVVGVVLVALASWAGWQGPKE